MGLTSNYSSTFPIILKSKCVIVSFNTLLQENQQIDSFMLIIFEFWKNLDVADKGLELKSRIDINE